MDLIVRLSGSKQSRVYLPEPPFPHAEVSSIVSTKPSLNEIRFWVHLDIIKSPNHGASKFTDISLLIFVGLQKMLFKHSYEIQRHLQCTCRWYLLSSCYECQYCITFSLYPLAGWDSTWIFMVCPSCSSCSDNFSFFVFKLIFI